MNHTTNVSAFLLDGKDPGRIALQWIGEHTTYGELRQAAAQVAGYLLQNGARRGDRVILVSENSLFWAAAYLGSLRAGLISVPLPPSISSQDFAYVVETSGATSAFTQSGFAVKHSAILDRLRVVTDRAVGNRPHVVGATDFEDLRKLPFAWEDPCDSAFTANDLAALMFTSGSTGKPRGVMVSHANIIANTESIIEYLELTADDRILAVLPFHYCFGASLLHTHLRVGACLLVDYRFRYPETILQRMQETGCTGFAGVPSHFQILLRNSSLRRRQLSSLRYVQQAGGRLAPTFIRELCDTLPGVKVFIMYGQTEATARLSYLPPEYLDTKIGSIGRGMPGVTLRVLNESGNNVPPGEVGEIVAQGANIAQGYWPPTAEADPAGCFRRGTLHTGDLATVDSDGFIYIVDRINDFVKCGGQRVSCQRIEDHLLACEDLLEAAVVATPDEVLGEAVKAFVVPRQGPPTDIEKRVRTFCRENMPPQLIPKELVFLYALPKNSSGKVMKLSLKTAMPDGPAPHLQSALLLGKGDK